MIIDRKRKVTKDGDASVIIKQGEQLFVTAINKPLFSELLLKDNQDQKGS